jgi:GWxTD domain-containing protein
VKKIFLLFFSLTFWSVTAQEENRYFTNINFEDHIIAKDNKYLCYLSYSIAYNQLVFVKENNKFLGGFNISFEIFDDTGFVKREYGTYKIYVAEFNATNSSSLKVNGVSELLLDKKKYLVKPFITVNNTNITLPCMPIEIDLKNKVDSLLFKPISVTKNNNGLYLVNENNSISFEDENSSLLFLFSNKPNKIEIKIGQKDKIVYDKIDEPQTNGGIKLRELDNSLLLQIDTTFSNYSLYLLSNLSRFLDEGYFTADLIVDGKIYSYKLKSEWLNKPKSLAYPEIVISALSIILPQDTIVALNRLKEDEFYPKVKSIFEKKYSSTSKFNKQFSEFFNRVDYAEMNFRTLKSKLGVESDRGIIYIKYGKPDTIEREYRARDDVSEIWNYKGLNKTFIFTDKTGTGDYVLVK